jgi:hypothetical protein
VSPRRRLEPLECECGYRTVLDVVSAAVGSRPFHLFECPNCTGRTALYIPAGRFRHAEPLTREDLDRMEEFAIGTVGRAFGRPFEEVAAYFADVTRGVRLVGRRAAEDHGVTNEGTSPAVII